MDDDVPAPDQDGGRETERAIPPARQPRQAEHGFVSRQAYQDSEEPAENGDEIPDFDEVFEFEDTEVSEDAGGFQPAQQGEKPDRTASVRADVKKRVDRVRLGIEGLDEMLGGGLIKHSVSAIIGTYGTGKTTFAINFIFEGLEQGETCIFISLDERADMLRESIIRRGFDLDAYLDRTFYLIKLDPTDFTLAINSIKNEIPSLIRETKASRIVIDPISLFEGLLPDEASRRMEMFKFVERMRDANCTLLLTSETDTQIPYASKYGLVEYLVDCVILLRYVRASDLSGTHLAAEVVKMRRSSHSREIKPYEIQPDDVVVYSEASVF